MKTFILYFAIIVFWIGIFAGIYFVFQKEEPKLLIEKGEKIEFFGKTVYITETAEKYHNKTCRFVDERYSETKEEKAIYLGKTKCKLCFDD